METLPIVEIFGPTIQGEGAQCGALTHFIRTGGCGHRCNWCDTMYAVDPEQVKVNSTYMTTDEIVAAIAALPRAPWVTLSGGDPCIHRQLGEVIARLHELGYRIALETQGSINRAWIASCDHVTLSPKGPSSGMTDKIGDFTGICGMLNEAGVPTAVKVVVAPDRKHEDLEFAMRIFRDVKITLPSAQLFVQVCSPTYELLGKDLPDKAALKRNMIIHRYDQLCEHIIFTLTRHPEELPITTFRILPQMHSLIWPSMERGK